MILLSRVRGLHDRLMPKGSRRRKLSKGLFRAMFIVATEGLSSLIRKVAKRSRRSLVFAGQSLRIVRPSREVRPRPIPFPATGSESEVTSASDHRKPTQRVYRPHVTPARMRGRFALLTSSLGNCYFDEIRDLIATGLVELGNEVVIRNEKDAFPDDVDRHIVVAPHEFFYLGDGEKLRQSDWPSNVIIVSTEQPSTQWFALCWECLPRAHAVWDIDFNTSRLLRRRGIACDYLPLGYSSSHKRFERVDELPRHYGTCFLEEDVLRSPAAGGPLHARPMDIFFVGSHTPRRDGFFCRAAAAFADYRTYLHLYDNSAPQLLGKSTYMDAATVHGLSQRSKVLLNVHHGMDVYFEWQRIVLQGLWHRTLVVSEPCSLAPPFRAGLDYVEATLQEMPRALRYYLSDPRGRFEAQEIADAGHRTLVSECGLGRFLQTLLTRPASSGAVLDHFERVNARAASPLVACARFSTGKSCETSPLCKARIVATR